MYPQIPIDLYEEQKEGIAVIVQCINCGLKVYYSFGNKSWAHEDDRPSKVVEAAKHKGIGPGTWAKWIECEHPDGTKMEGKVATPMPPPTADKFKVFVWRGKGVLENYGTGLVVVLAPSELEAWEKMKAEQFGVYCNLFHGAHSWFDAQSELDEWIKERDEDGELVESPILPVCFELNAAPVLHMRGTD
jgi:hypothetical protein